MFSSLTNFGYKRSLKEAIGFYLAYCLVAVLLGGLLGGIVGVISGVNNYELGIRIGTISSTLLALILGFLIARSKGLLKSFSTILIIIFSGIISLFLGALGGLIPIAYLSSRAPSDSIPFQPTASIDGGENSL